jgi:dipeptidyl aminopeptidase/acylaminoacyl peptidase
MLEEHMYQEAPEAGRAFAGRKYYGMRLRAGLVFLFLCASLAFAQASPSASKPRLTLDEFFNSVDLTSVRLSPDGHMVAISTERADWDAERFRRDLWLWRDSDKRLIPLTQSGHDWSPEWSPDGNWIAFLSDRRVNSESPDSSDDSADETHLYVIPVGGGEAFPVTRGEEGVHTFAWAPDSKTLYFATRTPWSSKQKDDFKSAWKDTIRYREQERGDVISRITVADALARRAVKGGQESRVGA